MGHISKPRFKKGTTEWIALMPISLAGRTIAVGDIIKKGDLRLHVLRNLYLRGRVAPAGHPWTERALERRLARMGVTPEPVADKVVEPVAEPVVDSEEAQEKPAPRRSRRKVQNTGDS